MNMQIRLMNIHKCYATHHEPAVINSTNPGTALDIHTDRHADRQTYFQTNTQTCI